MAPPRPSPPLRPGHLRCQHEARRWSRIAAPRRHFSIRETDIIESSAASSSSAAGADIAVSRVTQRFEVPRERRQFTALEDVSLDVRGGEFVSIVGPSGCGKSTLLGMMAGLVPITEGRIVVGNRPVDGVDPRLGYVFQRDAVFPWKTVAENVGLPLLFRGVDAATARARVADWITRIGLRGFERYHPYQLSGGMRKRVALAMTMVYEPEIILMDEPFGALDVQTRNLMENDLLDIWAHARRTVVFVTHDLEEAIALSDRVIVMTASPGRIKAVYPIGLPRPRSVTEVRFHPDFGRLYETIWKDLKDEVRLGYERSQKGAVG
jgi:NitT/TauT family transport system ATP-binding protein